MERVLEESLERVPTRLLSYCLMRTHWHLVLWPREDGELSAFMNWLTLTHTQRWRHAHHTVGYGSLYQGRFKSFPIQCDQHLLSVCRYVERNPLRAGAVQRVEDWRWSSLWHRQNPGEKMGQMLCDDWPAPRPANWLQRVQQAETAKELEALRLSSKRGQPFGDERWQIQTAKRLELESTLRPPGRPKKQDDR
jgi:putative transposase